MDVEVDQWYKYVESAIIEENTDFFDEEFEKSDDFENSSPNVKDFFLLHFAVARSTERMIKYFLNKGIPPDERTETGQTALHVAVIHYKHSVMEFLLNHGCPIDGKDESGCTPLHHAVEGYRERYLSSQLDLLDSIHHLISRGADVNASNDSGDTPLFQAIKHGSMFLVRLLLRHGADIEYRRGGHGVNALHMAVQEGHRNIVEILLDTGADVNSIIEEGPFEGGTALHLAANSAYSEEIVHLLIERGATVNAKDHVSETPIFMAVRACDGVEISRFESIIKLLLARGADVHCKNASGRTAFHIAVKYASKKVVEMLINSGAPINERSSNGSTPLHYAVQLQKEMHVKLLLSRGADTDVTDVDGCTPLHYAARLPLWSSIVEILLNNGADPLVRSNDDKSPLDYAVENLKIIKFLLSHIAYLEAAGDPRASEVAVRGIGNDAKLLSIYENCQREIVSMKELKIYGNFNYFDLIKRNLDNLVRNEEFVKAFENNTCVLKKYYFYGKLLNKFYAALEKKNLTLIAIEYLSKLFSDVKVPIAILEEILKFFGLHDLKNFVRFCQETSDF